MAELLASCSGSGTPLIQLGVLILAVLYYTHKKMKNERQIHMTGLHTVPDIIRYVIVLKPIQVLESKPGNDGKPKLKTKVLSMH